MIDKAMMKAISAVIDEKLKDVLTFPYPENTFLMSTIMQKLTSRGIVESGMRTESGKPLSRPNGIPVVLSPQDQILLSPKQLFEQPTPDVDSISSKTVIAPRSERPLKLDIPIIVTGMSLGGSLSIPIKTALAKGATQAGMATNMGESVVTEYERGNANHLIGQFHWGSWVNPLEDMKQVDAIEVQFGQGYDGTKSPNF